jgi:hypothetical protein
MTDQKKIRNDENAGATGPDGALSDSDLDEVAGG